MPATKFCVVWSAASNLVLRITAPDVETDDSWIAAALQVIAKRPGESVTVFNLADYPQRDFVTMQAVIGPPAYSNRCHAVSADGSGLIVKPPFCQDIAFRAQTTHGETIVQSDVADVGWTFDGAQLYARFVTVDPKLLTVTATQIVTDPNMQTSAALLAIKPNIGATVTHDAFMQSVAAQPTPPFVVQSATANVGDSYNPLTAAFTKSVQAQP